MADRTGALTARSLVDAARLVAGDLDRTAGPTRIWVRDADGQVEQLAGPGASPASPVEVATAAGSWLLLECPGVAPGELHALTTLLAATSDRLAAEQDAALARQRIADTERVGRMGSFDWDVRTDRNHWSDELFRIYGLQPGAMAPGFEQFLGRIHPDDREEIRATLSDAIATSSPFEIEERIVRPDGEVRTLRSFGEVVTDDDGAPLRLIGVCRDITEQRLAEEDALAAEGRVAEAEQRRRQALELNDTVVQGLITLRWHLGDAAGPEERRLIAGALDSAKRIMADLLRSAGDELDAEALLRTSHVGAAPTPPDPPAPTAPGPRGPAVGSSPRRRRVVVADDAADLRLLLRHRLHRDADVEVVGEAEDGEQAVTLVDRHRPDVVLLDLSMPVLDGLGAATRIRTAAPTTHIIVFSGYPAETMRDHALRAGADTYIEKTSDLAPLLECLAALPDRPGSLPS